MNLQAIFVNFKRLCTSLMENNSGVFIKSDFIPQYAEVMILATNGFNKIL